MVNITTYDFYRNIFQIRDESLIQELVRETSCRTLKKGEHLFRAGEAQNDVYFLEEGLFRSFFINIDGKDSTDCFGSVCGAAAMAFCRLELNVPSPMTIEALEDSRFFCIPISVVMELQKTYLEITLLYNQLLIAALDAHWKMKQILHQYSAIQRYEWFLQEYPGLIDRVSNKHIASFLGMTPVTLSRLRRSLREEQKKAGRESRVHNKKEKVMEGNTNRNE